MKNIGAIKNMIDPQTCLLFLVAVIFVLCVAKGTHEMFTNASPKKPCHTLRDVKYVRLSKQLPVLEIAEVQVYDEHGLNLAPLYGKPVQSSTWQNNTMMYGPQIAVNGNTSGLPEKGEVAKTSVRDLQPIWELALPRNVAVTRVTVYLRDFDHHPNPESSFNLKKNMGVKLELLCPNKTVLWERMLTEWKPMYDFVIR